MVSEALLGRICATAVVRNLCLGLGGINLCWEVGVLWFFAQQ